MVASEKVFGEVAGTVVAEGFEGWPQSVLDELRTHEFNGRVGQTLLRETEDSRVWEIRLQPGERVNLHRHVLHYLWFALSSGRGRQHLHDGSTRETEYQLGDSRYFEFGDGEYLLHDLENSGDTVLAFITVEVLDSVNAPLSL